MLNRGRRFLGKVLRDVSAGPELQRQPTAYLLDFRRPADFAAVQGKEWQLFTDAKEKGSSVVEYDIVLTDSVNHNTPERDRKYGVELAEFDRAHPRLEERFVLSDRAPALRMKGHVKDRERLIQNIPVSVEGYCGIRAPDSACQYNLEEFDLLELRVRTDGKQYMLTFQGESFDSNELQRAFFTTPPNTWATCQIPFTSFFATSGGNIKHNQRGFDPSAIESMLFVINAEAGVFQCDIGWLRALRWQYYET